MTTIINNNYNTLYAIGFNKIFYVKIQLQRSSSASDRMALGIKGFLTRHHIARVNVASY